MKHVRIKKERTNKILDAMGVISEQFPGLETLLSGRAFGVNHTDKCPDTGKKRVFLLDSSGFDVFAWIYEEFTETV